ncbi:MAG: protein YgfX [Pseudomonadota bacterium]
MSICWRGLCSICHPKTPVTSASSPASCNVWRPELRLQASRWLFCWRLTLAVLAVMTALFSHPPLIVTILLVLLWPLLAFWQLSAGETSHPVLTLQHTPQGWRLELPDDQVHFAELAGPVRINRFFIVLCWRELAEAAVAGKRLQRWRVVIWADQVSADDWRRLSVALRWRRREGSSGDRMLSARVALSSG